MNHDESIIQAEIVKALSCLGVFLFSIPNEGLGKASMARVGRFRAMGMRSGLSDLVLIGQDGKAHFLEIKTPEGRLSEAQDRFRRLCLDRNWPYAVARSVAEATYHATAWGLIK
jgi:hypothetical protein